MKTNNQLKSLIILAFTSIITACGGGGGSTTDKPTVIAPTSNIVGEPVSISYASAQTASTDQCHSSAVENNTVNFTEISQQAGLNFSHSMPNGDGILGMSGGVAAGDFNSDCWTDLYAIGGAGHPNLLLINQQDGSFKDDANFANVDLLNRGSGPSFADIDGDGLKNIADNCPVNINPLQEDLDEDGIGDICDVDIDGDSINNDIDNCRIVANPSQADFDTDGLGDACDSDDDNDNVADASDFCPATALGSIVDPSMGCSIAQLVPCEGPVGSSEAWKSHGQYVSTVAKTSENFVEQELITEAEKDAIMSVAGSSSCGAK